MLLSLLFPARAVLFMGDEALHVYDVDAGHAHLVDTVPWNAEGFEELVGALVRDRCKGKPVMILNDMVEQHYRKERIPKVSPLDRATVLNRRLQNAFQAHPVRAALPLKDKSLAMRAEGGSMAPSGNAYLFAALPMSDALKKTIGAVKASLSHVDGFCLLPIENASMVHTLSKRLSAKTGKPYRWTLFMGQHHNGGLRQLVTRDGELALTRMTPIVDTDEDPEAWSRDVINEFKATMSYLTRFGFDANDGLNIIVICGNSRTDSIEDVLGREGSLHLLSSLDAADALGLNIGQQDDVRYADPLHAAWIGRKRSLILPLSTKSLDQIAQPRRWSYLACLVMIGLIVFLAFRISFDLYNQLESGQSVSHARQEQTAAHAVLEQQKAEVEATGYDFKIVSAALQTFKDIELKRLHPQETLRRIAGVIDPDIRLFGLRLREPPRELGTVREDVFDEQGNPMPRSFQVTMDLMLPAGLFPEEAYKRLTDLQNKLIPLFPAAKVTITSQAVDLGYGGRITGEAAAGDVDAPKMKAISGQLSIEGILP
jgi:hypothetical protein